MANRNFPSQKMFGFHLLPARIDLSISIGAAGAVSSFSGPGVNAVTHDGTGVYKILLQDNYYSFLSLNAVMRGTVTGAAADPHGQTVGTLYQITTVGNTNWVTAGIPAGITPAVGQVYALAAQPASGTGRAKAFAPSAISNIQVAGDPNLMNNNQPFVFPGGSFITIVCQGPTDATHTALIPADPASGEVILAEMWMNMSSVQ